MIVRISYSILPLFLSLVAFTKAEPRISLVEGGSETKRMYRLDSEYVETKPTRWADNEATERSTEVILAPIDGKRIYTKESFNRYFKDKDDPMFALYDHLLSKRRGRGGVIEIETLDPLYVTEPPMRTTISSRDSEAPIETTVTTTTTASTSPSASGKEIGRRRLRLVTLSPSSSNSPHSTDPFDRTRSRKYLGSKNAPGPEGPQAKTIHSLKPHAPSKNSFPVSYKTNEKIVPNSASMAPLFTPLSIVPLPIPQPPPIPFDAAHVTPSPMQLPPLQFDQNFQFPLNLTRNQMNFGGQTLPSIRFPAQPWQFPPSQPQLPTPTNNPFAPFGALPPQNSPSSNLGMPMPQTLFDPNNEKKFNLYLPPKATEIEGSSFTSTNSGNTDVVQLDQSPPVFAPPPMPVPNQVFPSLLTNRRVVDRDYQGHRPSKFAKIGPSVPIPLPSSTREFDSEDFDDRSDSLERYRTKNTRNVEDFSIDSEPSNSFRDRDITSTPHSTPLKMSDKLREYVKAHPEMEKIRERSGEKLPPPIVPLVADKFTSFTSYSRSNNGSIFEELDPLNRPKISLTSNEKLGLCCRKQQVSPHCQTMCNFDTFNDKTLVAAFLTAQCPGPELGKAYDCASSKVDHSACCHRLGLSTFLGGKCMPFCQTHTDTPRNVFDYLPCLQVFDSIKTCYREYQEHNKNLFGD